MVQAKCIETLLEPVLEVELLVAPSFTFDKLAFADRLDALFENDGSVRHESVPDLFGELRIMIDSLQEIDMRFDSIASSFQKIQCVFDSVER